MQSSPNFSTDSFPSVEITTGSRKHSWLISAISCRTFVGYHLSDQEAAKISDDLFCMTAAMDLVNIPLTVFIPYTRVWKGKRAATAVRNAFIRAAAASRRHMATGGKPTCIVDRWISIMMESSEYQTQVAAGNKDLQKPAIILREFFDYEIAQVLFTFLFASQDASSSATTWLFQIMAQRPEILDRIREEALNIRHGERHASISLNDLASMAYTNAVVKEVLRYRPPVIFVPYVTTTPFVITPTYTAPRGAMIIPSCYPALHDPEVYLQPDVFDPERWISGNANEQTKNWLVFGAGPHQCIAQQYVSLTLMSMIEKASLEIEWTHHASRISEEIKVFACLFPMASHI
jgi:C-22 sterol desaturase